MIEYIRIKNHFGEILDLEMKSPEKSGFFVRGIQGLGPSKSTINISEALSMNGGFYNSSRVTSKNLVLDIGFLDDGNYSIEQTRQQTYRFFPMNKPLTIEVKTENRTGIITGYVETNEPNIFSNLETTLISVLCPAAFFVDPNYVTTTFTGIISGFRFPWSNESTVAKLLQFSTIYINAFANVFYNGDVDNGLVFYIDVTGAVNNLTITFTTTGETMPISSSVITAMTGFNLKAGDKLEISTVRGNKYIRLIRSGVTTNILNALGANVSWFTLKRGDNLFTYSASSGVENLIFNIKHQLIYEGL